MSKEIDKRLRYAGNRTSRDAARLIFKAGERKEDKLSKLQAEIDELRAQIENNRGDFTYAEAQKRLQELEKELKGERGDEND
jgi:predicted  nucleic acid-binding Zn-ribbon protein